MTAKDKFGVPECAKLNKDFLNGKMNLDDYKNNPRFGQHIDDMDKVEDQCLKEAVIENVKSDHITDIGKMMNADEWVEKEHHLMSAPHTVGVYTVVALMEQYANYVSQIKAEEAFNAARDQCYVNPDNPTLKWEYSNYQDYERRNNEGK